MLNVELYLMQVHAQCTPENRLLDIKATLILHISLILRWEVKSRLLFCLGYFLSIENIHCCCDLDTFQNQGADVISRQEQNHSKAYMG